ncbi:unnamed protein product [Clonostachys rhizophaga]|uniref:Uncharacterized protein n=1 Tax=Clonostachys rhizophaga TaxID=160324 RepID=A0A9N9VG04_9HYPO|nr:unnamed protein product [Clonostachys rhizophaga]
MEIFQVEHVYFKDGSHAIFIMKEKSDVSGDLIRHITQNGTNQVSIERGIKLKETYPDYYMKQIGEVDDFDANKVLEMAQTDTTASQKDFREWTNAFIEELKAKGWLWEQAPGANLPPGWGSS